MVLISTLLLGCKPACPDTSPAEKYPVSSDVLRTLALHQYYAIEHAFGVNPIPNITIRKCARDLDFVLNNEAYANSASKFAAYVEGLGNARKAMWKRYQARPDFGAKLLAEIEADLPTLSLQELDDLLCIHFASVCNELLDYRMVDFYPIDGLSFHPMQIGDSVTYFNRNYNSYLKALLIVDNDSMPVLFNNVTVSKQQYAQASSIRLVIRKGYSGPDTIELPTPTVVPVIQE